MNTMRLEHQTALRQDQRLILTQQQILGLNLLQMNNLELEAHLATEVEQNPLLELVPPAAPLPVVSKPAEGDTNDAEFADQVEDNILSRAKEGQDFSYNPDRFKTWDHWMESVTGEESLYTHLMGQLRATVSAPEELAVGEAIILRLDKNGYFKDSPETTAMELGVPAEFVRRILGVIKTFEPTGVGAADLRECLLLQIDAEHPGDKRLRELADRHLEALGNRRIQQIAKAMRLDEAEVERTAKRLATLEPRPGRAFSSGMPITVTPEIVIQEIPEDRREHGGPRYEAVLASERMSQVRVNPAYVRGLGAAADGMDKETRRFLLAKQRDADALIKNLSRREQTLINAARVIAETQEEFLDKGEQYLRPLRLKDIAEKVGAHESTMSRAVSGKYIQTPQGVLEMKYFFSTGLGTADGGDQSARAVQARIRAMIEGEDKSAPLSDQAIMETLRKEGLEIARRTVAKYREGMGIPTSGKRKQYG